MDGNVHYKLCNGGFHRVSGTVWKWPTSVTIPRGTATVRVAFKLNEIHSWVGHSAQHGPDKIFVRVNNAMVDLGYFAMGKSEFGNGNAQGITWSHTYSTSPTNFGYFEYWNDQRDAVVLQIHEPTLYQVL